MEIWKPIKGLESHYAVSNLGRVRGIEGRTFIYQRWGKINVRRLPERIIKQQGDGKGYTCVDIGGVPNRKVHHLVAEAFIGSRPEGMIIDHLNNIHDDNRASNLEWVTFSENTKRSWQRDGHKPLPPRQRDLRGRLLPN